MSPVFKILLALIAGFVLLLAGALTVIALTFDPNDYKADIKAQVKAQTGRDLQLNGPISLSLFPWLGARAEAVSLSNAAGFSDADFAALQVLDVRLRLWPLLSGDVEVGQIIVDGLVLNLERRADGTSNWDDFSAKTSEPAAEAPDPKNSGEPDLSQLKVAGIEIRDARIQWRDAGALTVVEGLSLETGAIAEGEASELELKVAVTLADETRVDLNLQSGWQFSLGGPSLALDALQATIKAQGKAIPGNEQSLILGLSALYDGALNRAVLSDGRLEMAGQQLDFSAKLLELDGAQNGEFALQGQGLDIAAVAKKLSVELPPEAQQWPALNLAVKSSAVLSQMTLPSSSLDLGFGPVQLNASAGDTDLDGPASQGHVHLAPFDLHAFLARLGYGLKQETSAGATHLDVDWQLAKDSLRLGKITGALAGEVLSGNMSVSQFSAPQIRANLELAALRLAHWSGKDEAKASGDDEQDKSGGNINEMEVPMDWAKDLNLTARAAISRLDVYGVKFDNVLWTADARPGTPVKQNLSAKAYGGQLAVNNQIDARQKEPQLGLNFSAKALGLGKLLQDGWGSQWISGTTELGLNLASRGATVGKLRSSANGDANYRLKDGAVRGVSLVDIVRKAGAALQGEKSSDGDNSTSFSELFGRAVVESGKLRVQEFAGGNSWLKLGGDGFVDLLAGHYDLQLAPTLLDNEQTRSDKYLSRLIGLAIPVSVSGPLTAPKFKVDLEQLAKEQAKSKLNEKKDELRDKARDKLGDFLRKL